MRSDDLLPLLRHMEWADALVWRAVLALPAPAAADPALPARLFHVHIVQRAFLAIWRGAPLTDLVAWIWTGRPAPEWSDAAVAAR